MNTDMTRRQMLVASMLAAASFSPLVKLLAAEKTHGGGSVDAGELAGFAKDAIYPSFAGQGFFVVRKDGRLFAEASRCTHKNGELIARGDGFVCRKHGSTFTVAGHVTKGPAREDLPRFGISLDDRKHVLVDTAKVFRSGEYESKDAFVVLD